jgi:murein DD-endopeptidase MepM/ murein hydrolase activator NlpD
MPVTAMRANEPLGLRTRLLLGAMVVVLLGSLGVADSPRAEARNWMREISATRASQLYYESLMRAADSEVRSLKHARTQTRRSLKVAQRRLEATAHRRGQAKRDLRLTRTRARLSRLSLAAAAFETPPPPDAATAVLSLTGAGDIDGIASIPIVAQAAAPNLGLLSAPGSGHPLALPADVSVSDVVALERQVATQQRRFQQARQRALRAWRFVRAKRNSLAAMAMRQRSATARREGAEAALAGRILAMSALAQRRVAKKTNVRPGVNSGFTWPTRGRISQTYGRLHDGLDIAGYQGTAIRAAAVGVISYIGWNPWDQSARAFIIVVAHPGGYETLYGHVLPTRQVRVGQVVHRGEVIGYMGNTGRSSGVHLHFEMRRGGTTLNPAAFL